ncbi:MAG: hypothetical protein RLZZ480_811, partial [Candidatus Parcubacteria bacterium]
MLVAGASFGLGRMSVSDGNKAKALENKGNFEALAPAPTV